MDVLAMAMLDYKIISLLGTHWEHHFRREAMELIFNIQFILSPGMDIPEVVPVHRLSLRSVPTFTIPSVELEGFVVKDFSGSIGTVLATRYPLLKV